MAQAPDKRDAPRRGTPRRAAPQRDPPPRGAPQHPDLLAAVVLHTLVQAGAHGTTTARTIAACERDPDSQADRTEVEAALQSLIADGLAYRRGARVGPTRAALRADALSF